jgi:hypothetical protein
MGDRAVEALQDMSGHGHPVSATGARGKGQSTLKLRRARVIRSRRLLGVITGTALLAGLTLALPAPAEAASKPTGTLAGGVTFSQDCPSGIGVGIAYDGANLWYSCYDSSPDLLRADPTTGQVTATYNIEGGLGALAYDAKRNALWAGWGGPNTGSVWLIQLGASKNVTGSSVAFSTCDSAHYSYNYCSMDIDDGLTYDATYDTVYVSPDTSQVIRSYQSDGTFLNEVSWAGGSNCYNSGIAIGDQLLFEGADGCNHVYVVDRTDPSTVKFDFSTAVSGDPNFRDEGLACDTNTFAGQGEQVMWSKEAYSPMRAHAFVIPDGSCGVGGKPASGGAGAPAAQVLFLHGVTESAKDNSSFSQLLGGLPFGGAYVSNFTYYQDASGSKGDDTCNPQDAGQQTPPRPDASVALPFDGSQNGALCDSEGDLGQNASRLDAEIKRLYNTNHVPVILIGYSMGGETIRSFLSYSTHLGGGVADHMVDSVVMLHGVEQGSWLANGGPALFLATATNPFVGTELANLIGQWLPNPNRAAVKQFAPVNSYVQWVDTNSDRLPPNMPTYNTYGDERVSLQSCVLFIYACLSHDYQHWGDVVLKPGSPNPQDTPLLGGARFLPGGYAANHWEWAETHRIYWNPIVDPGELQTLYALWKAPEQHMNYTSTESQLTVKDCQTGQDINEKDELIKVVGARMRGTTYACSPPAAPTGPMRLPRFDGQG